MKFTINKNRFIDKLAISQKAMASRSNLPALSGILIRCENNQMTMVTANGESSIKIDVKDPSLDIRDDGVCLVPGKLFGDIVRKLDGEMIDFELEEDNIMRVQAGNSDITLNLFDVEDYPEQTFIKNEQPVKVKAALLKELIKQTTFAASMSDIKPILTGVNIKISGNEITGVATDRFRISKKTAKLEEEFLDMNIIIPARSLNEVDKIIENEAGYAEINVSDKKVLVKYNDIMFQTRLIDGSYPDAQRLIPAQFPVSLRFDKQTLMSIIDRVSTLSVSQNSTTVVNMIIDKENVTMISNSPELGTIRETVKPLEANVETNLQISFSAAYFLDALKAFYSQEVKVMFSGEIKPFIFEADNDEGLVELVLPRRAD